MKIYSLLLVLLTTLSTPLLASTKKTVAIFPLTDAGTTHGQKLDTLSLRWSNADAHELQTYLQERLTNNGNYKLVSKNNIDALTRSQQQRSFYHTLDIAGAMDIDYLIYGEVQSMEVEKQSPLSNTPNSMEGRLRYQVTVLDIKNSKVLSSQTMKTSIKMPIVGAQFNRLLKTLRIKAVDQIVENLEARTHPLIVQKASQGYILLKNTSNTTVTPGTQLEICLPCKTHFDEETGNVAGDSEFTIAGAKVVEQRDSLIKAQITNYKMEVQPGAICHIKRS